MSERHVNASDPQVRGSGPGGSENASLPPKRLTTPAKRWQSEVTLREVSRALDLLPDYVHDLVKRTYRSRGGRPGELAPLDRDAWCHALTAGEDELEMRTGRLNAEARVALRGVRRRLEM
jgi:hypothetical protein